MVTVKVFMRKISDLVRSARTASLERTTMILAGALIITVVLVSFDFRLLEANLYDFRMARGPQAPADQDITLITIDDLTTKSLNDFSPLPLDIHVRFMEALEKLNPRAVGYLVDMNHVSQANPALFHDQWGTRFVESAKRMEARGIPVLLGTPFDVTGEVLPPYPLSALSHAIAVIHKDGNVFSGDKITRRALTYLYEKPAFHVDLAQRLGILKPGHAVHGTFDVPQVEGQYFIFRYHGNTAISPSKTFDLPYHRISFLDVLQGSLPEGALAGKTVLIGTLIKEDSSDFSFTPYSSAPFNNPKLVLHANILDSIEHDDGLTRAPYWLNWVNTFAVVAFVLWWVLNSTPLYGLFMTVTLNLIFLAAGQVLFHGIGYTGGLWIREAQPLVGMFLAYYLGVPYRLIREYKKRWDYQRKNELLIQVEELKTNFLSLITHDLKTPVARIQGLTEVLLRKSSDRLIDRDKETLHNIIASTEELNRFITSILELTKVESNRLQINLESKDINQLIERAVEGFKTVARSRKVSIQMKLDPLFPIKIDQALISKVINNLIDNAIKYSPSNSEITIESHEVDDWIEISVRDQGIGISAAERDNLFTKFYRAKNDTTAQIAGTGLGLYLTKYFIEAHHGRVMVESEPEKGSMFKILLPIALSPAKALAAPVEGQAGHAGLALTRRFAHKFTKAVLKEDSHV